MRVTHRFWSVAGIGVALAAWGIAGQSPVLVLGAGAIGTWLLVAQYLFVSYVRETLPNVDVGVRAAQEHVTAGDAVTVTLSAAVDAAVVGPIRVTSAAPAGAEGTIKGITVGNSGRAVSREQLTWPVAGRFAFARPQVTFVDRFGLFEQPLECGTAPTVTVEPRLPAALHVGQGGDRSIAGFGEHDTGRTGSGLKPAEVREYVPGDAVREMDWKATARLAEPHVREFEIQTDRETKLFVDHRGSMATGPDGEQKLDYARQLALAILESARRHDDPVGCYAIGDVGLTAEHDPSTGADHRDALRRTVLDLSPTTLDGGESGVVTPATAGHRARLLTADSSAFAGTLAPYFEDRRPYTRRVAERPLVTAVTTYRARQGRAGWSVFVTDDDRKPEVREAVQLARRLGDRVSVYLTPSVLFEEAGIADLEAAYDRYVAFESFRRELDAHNTVDAFEVGPKDRLTTVLDAQPGQARRASQ